MILGNPNQWFDPNAFLQPLANSGFYGDLGWDTLIGSGLATWDFPVLKDTSIHERFRLQFRAEIFNLPKRANFNIPNLIVFTPSGVFGYRRRDRQHFHRVAAGAIRTENDLVGNHSSD